MKKIKGDLIQLAKNGEFDIIVHGCNCFNTMGSGIAKQIADNFPDAYEVDRRTLRNDKTKLGSFTVARIWYNEVISKDPFKIHSHVFYVVNAYTQYEYGTNKVNFDYHAFQTFLYSFKNYVELMFRSNIRQNERGLFNPVNIIRIGFPMIGSGLAGGDWSIIENMIAKFEYNIKDIVDITVVEYEK